MDDPDTDLLLVLVRSLLSPPLASLDQGALLDALLEADGDIERAAAALERGGAGQGSQSSSSTGQAGHKRARSDQGQIESWLDGPKSKRKSVVKASRSSAFATSTSSLPTQRPPQRPDSSTSKAKLAKAVVPLPPLLLANPKLLSDHLPCIAVPPSPLSPRLASALYCVLMDESASWTKNDYVINGLTVQSSHTTALYQNALDPPYPPDEVDESAKFWNNNSIHPSPPPFPPLLQEAATLVEEAVNAYLDSRPESRRFGKEWKGKWKAGIAGVNRYEGASSGVGLHADQLTYLGPYPTIASLSLGTSRKFRLRAVPSRDPLVRAAEGEHRTYDVPLAHNTLALMVPPCQEAFKHSIPPQKSIDLFRPSYNAQGQFVPLDRREKKMSRIAVTFRFYREDFRPQAEGRRQGTPRCGCGIPCTLKADQRGTVSLSTRPSSTSPSAPQEGTNDPYLFYWTCTRKAGGAASTDMNRAGDPPVGMLKVKDGCGFFRVLDMVKEGRDCGVGFGEA